MKFKVSLFILVLVLAFGCDSGEKTEAHGHEHGQETHSHGGAAHEHAHDEGVDHHEQEEFTVEEDSTAVKEEKDHKPEDGHEHEH